MLGRSIVRTCLFLGLPLAVSACSGDLTFNNGGGGAGAGDRGGGGSIGGGGAGATTTSMGGSTTTSGDGGTGAPFVGCGDNQVGLDEECDGPDLGGSDCTMFGYSTPAGLQCTPSCELDSSGCSATCDGALLEPGEVCDGADTGVHDCTEFGFSDPAGLACDGCMLDSAACAGTCGDGVAEPDETCDLDDLKGVTCMDFGFTSPIGAVCVSNCSVVDATSCQATCDGTLEPTEVCDGVNLNGNDCTLFGFANPAGLTCVDCQLNASGCTPVCGNGLQEPGEQCDDGNLASGDGCSSTCALGGATCADAIPVALALGTSTFTGTTVGGGAHNAACASAALDRVYSVTPAATGFLTATLTRSGTGYASVLHARNACDDATSTILCADSVDPGGMATLDGGEVVSFPVSANQTVFVIVDGATAADVGTYELTLDLSTGTSCMDPIPVRIEDGSPMRLLGFTNGKTPSTAGTCGGLSADDVVYDITYAAGGNATVALDAAGTGYDSLLYTRVTCNNNQVGCSNAAGNGGESLSFDVPAGEHRFTWVDGAFGATGFYALVVTP